MPVTNTGNQRYRDLMRGSGPMNAPANSLGFGTDNTADDPTDNVLGDGGTSYWKNSTDDAADWTETSGGEATTSPWFQFAALFDFAEANANLGEIGISAGQLTGTNPAGNDGTKLVTRRAVGPLTKSSVFQLEGRVRIDHLHETIA